MRLVICDRCGSLIRAVTGDMVTIDGVIGNIRIETVTDTGLLIDGDPAKINNWEICPKCMKAIIGFICDNSIHKQPDPSQEPEKEADAPEPDADQREGTVDEAPAAPEEKQVDLTKFEPAEVHEDKPKSSVRMITPETRKQIRDLAKDGKSAREISELTGVSVPTANKYMRRATDGQAT